MDAEIIAFPGCATPQPVNTPADDSEFEAWYEDNIPPLVGDVAELERLSLETDRSDFWLYARLVRDAINSWPFPEDQRG